MDKDIDCCPTQPNAMDIPRDGIADRARTWARSPQALTIAGLAVVAAGLALNWNGLVAAGVAPLILSFAPCAAMCALGLCMNMPNRASDKRTGAGSGAATSPVSRPDGDGRI